ncbi:MAG TPA: acylneuraminate cytidylyltransferase, partial [Pirellulales bacterium]|nr:acylneuraminate cytidylyltransferase [Pirellulales bacterium]
YSIASGLLAKHVTRVVLSTDSEEIAAVGRAYGAETPFMRPAEHAQDDTMDFPVFLHAVEWLREHERYRPDVVVQLRPTTPLRPRGMVDESVEILLADPLADSVRGVTTPKQTPYKMWREVDGLLVQLLESEFAEPYNMPRQRLPKAWFQTGHIDAIRTTTIVEKHSLSGRRVRPLFLDSIYCVDIDTADDFVQAERLIERIAEQIDLPRRADGAAVRRWPEQVELVVFDFDGVHTDNRVLVLDDGQEAVLCDRGDGMGVALLRRRGVPMVVLSTEKHPIVRQRCEKLKIECHHGLDDKAAALRALCQERNVRLERTIYVGNDVNDLECMRAVGWSVAVADSHAAVLAQADQVLSRRGGFGAVRELCDLVLQRLGSPQPR